MKRFARILRKIFSLPPLPTVIIAAFGFGFVLAVAVLNIEIPALQYLSYIASAYALVITITALPRFIAFVKRTKQRVITSTFMKKIRGTAFGERFSAISVFVPSYRCMSDYLSTFCISRSNCFREYITVLCGLFRLPLIIFCLR